MPVFGSILIGYSDWVGQEYVGTNDLARMVQAQIDENDVVLDVASGAGYSASILGCIARVVVALRVIRFGKKSIIKMTDLGIDTGCGRWAHRTWLGEQAPTTSLSSTALAEKSQTLFEQLSEGGRLCAVTTGETV